MFLIKKNTTKIYILQYPNQNQIPSAFLAYQELVFLTHLGDSF